MTYQVDENGFYGAFGGAYMPYAHSYSKQQTNYK